MATALLLNMVGPYAGRETAGYICTRAMVSALRGFQNKHLMSDKARWRARYQLPSGLKEHTCHGYVSATWAVDSTSCTYLRCKQVPKEFDKEFDVKTVFKYSPTPHRTSAIRKPPGAPPHPRQAQRLRHAHQQPLGVDRGQRLTQAHQLRQLHSSLGEEGKEEGGGVEASQCNG